MMKILYREQYLKRVDYKFSYNLAQNPDVRLYTWQNSQKSIIHLYNKNYKGSKSIEDFSKNQS